MQYFKRSSAHKRYYYFTSLINVGVYFGECAGRIIEIYTMKLMASSNNFWRRYICSLSFLLYLRLMLSAKFPCPRVSCLWLKVTNKSRNKFIVVICGFHFGNPTFSIFRKFEDRWFMCIIWKHFKILLEPEICYKLTTGRLSCLFSSIVQSILSSTFCWKVDRWVWPNLLSF